MSSDMFVDDTKELRRRLSETQDVLNRSESAKLELASQKRLAEQRAQDAESKVAGLEKDLKTERTKVREMGLIVEQTVVLQERAEQREKEANEARDRAQRAEDQLAATNGRIKALETERNDAVQIQREQQQELDQARKMLDAFKRLREAQADLDQLL